MYPLRNYCNSKPIFDNPSLTPPCQGEDYSLPDKGGATGVETSESVSIEFTPHPAPLPQGEREAACLVQADDGLRPAPLPQGQREVGVKYRLALALLVSGLFLVFPLMPVAENLTRVKTARLADIATYPRQSAPATVVSLNNSYLSAQIKARIDEISARVGEVVETGSVLARLDCADYRLAAQQADASIASLKARIELAERRLARTRQLMEKQTVSEELLDEREADLTVLRADHRGALSRLEKAKIDVSRCTIKSPYRAVIISRMGSVGEFADVGTNLVEVVDIEQLEISAQVPTRDIERIKNITDLYFEDSANRYKVELRAVTPAINTQTRNREARLLFSNGPALPGAAGKLTWRDNRPHVPAKLLVRRNDDFGIFLDDNGKADFHVIPGAQQGRTTPVALPPDTLLVTEGHYSLQDAQAITASER